MTSAILFDLDGTLVDTAPDLGYALNLLLKKYGKSTLDDHIIRPVASNGSRGLIHLGFGVTPEDESFIQLRNDYLDIYDSVFTRSPKLFEGMDSLLDAIETKGLQWGVVTNKPSRFTYRLMQSIQLADRAGCIVSGDDAAKPKPAPLTLFLACEKLGVKPQDCIYVGDAARDIEAGRAAGMKTVVALFGYIAEMDKPHEWGADVLIENPIELLSLIS